MTSTTLRQQANDETIVLRNGKVLAVSTIALGFMLIIGSALLVGHSNPLLITGGILAGLACIPIGIMLLSGKPQVIITREGIEDLRLQTGVIPWEQITKVSYVLIATDSYVCLTLRDPQQFPVCPVGLHAFVQPSRRKSRDLSHVNLYTRPLKMKERDLIDLIRQRAGIAD